MISSAWRSGLDSRELISLKKYELSRSLKLAIQCYILFNRQLYLSGQLVYLTFDANHTFACTIKSNVKDPLKNYFGLFKTHEALNLAPQ